MKRKYGCTAWKAHDWKTEHASHALHSYTPCQPLHNSTVVDINTLDLSICNKYIYHPFILWTQFRTNFLTKSLSGKSKKCFKRDLSFYLFFLNFIILGILVKWTGVI